MESSSGLIFDIENNAWVCFFICIGTIELLNYLYSVCKKRNQVQKEQNQTTAHKDNKQKEVDLGLIPALYNSLKEWRM